MGDRLRSIDIELRESGHFVIARWHSGVGEVLNYGLSGAAAEQLAGEWLQYFTEKLG